MSDPVEDLLLDLLEWIGPHSRRYAEVAEAWRTSCPQLPVWEEAHDRGLVEQCNEPARGPLLLVSAKGREYLSEHRGLGAWA